MFKYVNLMVAGAMLLCTSAAVAQRPLAPGPIRRNGPQAPLSASEAVGIWDWFNRATVDLLPDGMARGLGAETGRWYRIDAERPLVIISWKSGWVDTLVLSPDGMRLDGRNLQGQVVSGMRRMQAPVVMAPQPMPLPIAEYKHPVEAGPIWSNDDAQAKCPSACPPPEHWNGQWWTTVQGQMSVCECVGPMGAQPPLPPRAPAPNYAPPAPPPPMAYNEEQFRGFMHRLREANFTDAQLATVRDETNAGARWNTQQVIAVMKVLNFSDPQVQSAVIMWPSVVDPQNFPAVAASLTFEGDRQKLRRALGK